jgi:hypothetical protein
MSAKVGNYSFEEGVGPNLGDVGPKGPNLGDVVNAAVNIQKASRKMRLPPSVKDAIHAVEKSISGHADQREYVYTTAMPHLSIRRLLEQW